MELNVQDWKEFQIGKFFNIKRGQRHIAEDREAGNIRYFSASQENNGLTDNISNPLFIDKDALIYSTFGNCYYIEGEFTASDEISILHYDNSNVQNGLFLSTVLTQNKYKYGFGRKAFQNKLTDEYFKLPILYNTDGTPIIDENRVYSDEGYIPDWQFMEDYIKSLHHKPITTKVKSGNVIDLEIDKWEEFKVSKLFNKVYKAKAHTKEEVVEVERGLHFVSRTDSNNGVDILVDNDTNYEGLEEANCITIGDTTATCYYQNEQFIAGDHMVVLRAEWLNLQRGLFIKTLFTQEGIRYCYGRAYRMDLIKNTLLKLPIKRDKFGSPIIDNNNTYSEKGYMPDWEFMESYINSLPYSDRLI